MRFTLPHDHGEARACLLIHLGPLTPTITNQTSPHFAEALAVLLEQPEGGFEVGGLGEAAAGGGPVGVSAAELAAAGAVDPVQEPSSVVEAGVGAHQVKHGQGVVDEVVGQSNSGSEGVGSNRLDPAVAEVAGQVEQASEPAGGAGELGCPAGQVGEVAAAGSQPGLQITLESQQ